MDIEKLSSDNIEDFKKLVEVFKDVFESDAEIPNNQHLDKLLSNPDFIVFVIKIDGKVVGGLTIYVLHQYYSVKPLAYIYDVGVLPNYQRKGLGKALMAEVYHFCEINGFDEAYVQAECEDIDAIHFYRKTNIFNEKNAIHFTYSFVDEVVK